MEKEMKASQLPKTDSIAELASFWESHEITEFDDQLEEVTDPVFERRDEMPIVLRLEPEEARVVVEIARSRGVPETELLREWVLEKLGSLRTEGSSGSS
jgi:CopG antitoxin of type II toxin-antitoxin system